jgi:hypothetical protein
MKRRVFLISAAAAVGTVIGWRLTGSRQQAAIAKVLYKRLDYLKLDAGGVRRFAEDLSSRKVISSLRLRILDAAGELYTGATPAAGGRIDRALRHGEDRIVTQYLISSDFFTHGADKTRTINYFGYYDPLVACNNPFARPVTVVPGS